MHFLPHTKEDIKIMMEAVSAESESDIFKGIPEKLRRKASLDLEDGKTEWEVFEKLKTLAGKMAPSSENLIFAGAGSYFHNIPAVVPYLVSRSEFSTAYTPYQPEISQGTLQAMYEYQTLVARLLGMDIANASMYDGASALAEALLMSLRVKKKKKKVAVSKAINPLYLKVVETYFAPTDFEIESVPFNEKGQTDLSSLENRDDLACIAVASPNFFGVIEDNEKIASLCKDNDSLFVSSFTEPFAFGLYKPAGLYGADIVCGEGQSMGLPQSYGGPGLGMFAVNNKYVRSMPGRLCGQTVDKDGKRGFVLTLATREQHIRREKATSNICSNQGLCATTSTIFMSCIGKRGIKEIAGLNHDHASYLKKSLIDSGFSEVFKGASFFNEFVLKAPDNFFDIWEKLAANNIVAGLPLADFFPEFENCWLFCVTEAYSKEKIDLFIDMIKKGGELNGK